MRLSRRLSTLILGPIASIYLIHFNILPVSAIRLLWQSNNCSLNGISCWGVSKEDFIKICQYFGTAYASEANILFALLTVNKYFNFD